MNRILSSMAIFQNSCVPPGNDPLKGGRPSSCLDVVQNAPVAFRRSVTKYEDSTDPATTNNHGYMPIIYIYNYILYIYDHICTLEDFKINLETQPMKANKSYLIFVGYNGFSITISKGTV